MDKESIMNYLDKGNKGYISLCDVGRILYHCILLGCLFSLPSIPGISQLIYGDISFTQFIITTTLCWILVIICVIATVILLVILSYIWYIIKPYYNKFKCKTKLCKIKLIKLK